jgi:hypothetical protein
LIIDCNNGILQVEFEIYDPEQGRVFIWGDKFYAKIKMKLTYKQDGIEKTKTFDQDAAGNPFQMTIQTGPYIYDDTGQPIPWNNPGFYNITYDGQSIFNFYVWGPVLDYINSDKYMGISNENGEDLIKEPLTIYYSIKEMEGVVITMPRVRIKRNESLVRVMLNIPVGDNQEITWDGKDERNNVVPPGEYEITISAFGNETDVETNPHKVIVFKVEVDTPCEALAPPYRCVDSFVAKRNRIEDRLTARIDSGGAPFILPISWTCEDVPGDGIDSGTCNPSNGLGVKFEFIPNPPDDPNGREFPLAYIVKATVTVNERPYEIERKIKQDNLDELRQEYEDLPERESQPRNNFDQDPPAYPGLLGTAAEPNRHQWHILRDLNQHARDVVNNYSGLNITSGYRCPIGNSRLPNSARNSNHQYGRAFDFAQGSSVENYNAYRAARDAGAAVDTYLQLSNGERYFWYRPPPLPNELPSGIGYVQGHVAW